MNVREYLKNYNQIGDEIRRLNSELNRLLECREDTYNTLKAQTLSDMPRSPREDGDDVVSKAAILAVGRFSKSIEYLTSQINELLDEQDLFNQVWFQQGLLSYEEKRIIDIRYFRCMQWDKVAKEIMYCAKQARRILMNAVNKLQNEIDSRA